MARKGEYLFKRRGSQMWWIRFQYTGEMRQVKGKAKWEFSLGTSDKREAELIAMPHIFSHQAEILLRRSNKKVKLFGDTINGYLRNGLHSEPDGRQFYVDGDKIIHLDDEGAPTGRTTENASVRMSLAPDLKVPVEFVTLLNKLSPKQDDEFIDVWIKQRNINLHIEREARLAWKL